MAMTKTIIPYKGFIIEHQPMPGTKNAFDAVMFNEAGGVSLPCKTLQSAKVTITNFINKKGYAGGFNRKAD